MSAPYMPLFVADYLADTAHLSAAEHGAYLLLIMNYWQRGKALPSDDRKLARIARMSDAEWMDAREAVAEFFDDVDGEWRHKRIEAEIAVSHEKSAKAKASARASVNARSANAERTLSERSTDAELLEKKRTEDTSSLRSDVGADAPAKPDKPSPRKILEDVLTPEMAAGVIEHRQRIKKPMTAIAAQGVARDLRATGEPDAAARLMIERGWMTVKPDWWQREKRGGNPRASPSQSQNPYLAIAAELGAFGRAADYDDITQAAGPYASEPSASRYAGDLSQPRGADAGNGRVLDLVAVRSGRG